MFVIYVIYDKKKYRFKHTCNDDNDIGHRKQQKLAYHNMFTCKFPVSYITMSADHDRYEAVAVDKDKYEQFYKLRSPSNM